MDSLAQIARDRLLPPLTDPSCLVLRSRSKILKGWFQELEAKPLKVLDVGGRYQPYRPLLRDPIAQYVAVDIVATEFVTVIADGQSLPFKPESFDLVIATQVFEYFPDPAEAARQIHSVLRPGGILVASMAAFCPRFAAGERWRFLPPGARSLLSVFQTVEVVPELHNLGGLVRSMNVGLSMIFRLRGIRSVYRWTACPLFNLLGLALESLELESDDRLTPNYSIRATK